MRGRDFGMVLEQRIDAERGEEFPLGDGVGFGFGLALSDECRDAACKNAVERDEVDFLDGSGVRIVPAANAATEASGAACSSVPLVAQVDCRVEVDIAGA